MTFNYLTTQNTYYSPKQSTHWIQSSLNTVKALEAVGGGLQIKNLNVIRKIKSPCVFVSNHMSILETFVLPCLIQPYRDVTFVIKESLLSFPFFKHVMRSRNPITVARDNPREDLKTVLNEGQSRINANISVIIFPLTFSDPLIVKGSGKEDHKFIVDFITKRLGSYVEKK